MLMTTRGHKITTLENGPKPNNVEESSMLAAFSFYFFFITSLCPPSEKVGWGCVPYWPSFVSHFVVDQGKKKTLDCRLKAKAIKKPFDKIVAD